MEGIYIQMKENLRSKKGITLIALITTVIVLLILAIVSISLIVGENGVMKRAQIAREKTIIGSEKEELSTLYLSAKLVKGASSLTLDDLLEEAIYTKIKADAEKSGQVLKFTFHETGNCYTLTVTGEIQKLENPSQIRLEELTTLITNVYNESNSNGLYYHDTKLANSAEDNSYRYSGENPNNYVMFNGEIWRIIGIIPTEVVKEDGTTEIKNLIKIIQTNYNSEETVFWDNNGTNNWETSTLQVALNSGEQGGYWNKLMPVSENIANVNWKVSGVVTLNLAAMQNYYAKNFYDQEIKNATQIWTGKVGLMYVSDYAYAITPDEWTRKLVIYDGREDPAGTDEPDETVYRKNWLWGNQGSCMEWTITREASTQNRAFRISDYGAILFNVTNAPSGLRRVARPVVYLQEGVMCRADATGTKENPYQIMIEEKE